MLMYSRVFNIVTIPGPLEKAFFECVLVNRFKGHETRLRLFRLLLR